MRLIGFVDIFWGGEMIFEVHVVEATLGDITIIFVTDCYEMLSPRIYNIDIDNLCNTCMVFNNVIATITIVFFVFVTSLNFVPLYSIINVIIFILFTINM